MAEPYESIGNRVMRHFRHVIDTTVHYWLHGNMIEPLEPIEEVFGGPSTSGLAVPRPHREHLRGEQLLQGQSGASGEPHEFAIPAVPQKREGDDQEESTTGPTTSKKRKKKTPKPTSD